MLHRTFNNERAPQILAPFLGTPGSSRCFIVGLLDISLPHEGGLTSVASSSSFPKMDDAKAYDAKETHPRQGESARERTRDDVALAA
jgi:hypothetical protein